MTYSPAQLLQNRHLRTTLPAHVNKFKQKLCSENEVKHQIERKTKISKKYYDQNAKKRNDFIIGDTVYVRNSNRWLPGVINKILCQ